MVNRRAAPLVGRDESLAVLRDAVRRAADGSPQVVLVSGETGVGKTRLVRELVRAESPTVLGGACVPMAGDPLPFGPLTQGLRRLAAHGTVRQQLGRAPALARLVPGLVPPSRVPAGDDGTDSSGLTQLGLFQAVLDLLGTLGAIGPVLHVVEDVHWADRSTLDLLRFLAVNLTSERVVVLVTHRADAVTVGSPLAGWLAEVGRLELSRRMTLSRLAPHETARLVADLLGAVPDPDTLTALLRRSDGNPLFVEHLVLAGDGDTALPGTLHELLSARVATLPEDTGSVLRALSVLGRSSAPAVLADTAGRSGDAVDLALRPAVEQHVIEVRDGPRVAFRHPAFGEVVYASLLPAEQTRLHRAAALALEKYTGSVAAQGGFGNHAAELARHWLRADDLPRALDAAVDAGRAAEAMFAFADAQASFGRAAELTERVPSEHDPVELLARAADAAAILGETADAVRLAEDALTRTDDPLRRASLCERLGSYNYLAGRGTEAETWYLEALGLLPDGDESALCARVLAGLALWAAAWSRLDDAVAWGERGLRVAAASGARREEGRLHNALGAVASSRGAHDDGIGHLRTALAIAQESDHPQDLATAYINLSHVLALAGRLDEVVELGREGVRALGRVGMARQRGSLLRANTCEALIAAGRLTEAATLLEEARALRPRGIMAAPVHLQEARLAVVCGDLRDAWEACEEARVVVEAESAPDAWQRDVIETAATIEVWAGRPAAAHELVIDGLHLVRGTDEERFGGPLAAIGMRALADQAEAHRDAATRRRLTAATDELDNAMAAARGRAEDAALRHWFDAERTRLDRRPDPVSWAETAAAWEQLGRPFYTSYARWREAEARLDRGADATAVAVLRGAHEAAIALGAVRLVDEVERLAGWHRIDLLPTAPDHAGAGEDDALAGYGLTGREREVLGGLAAGRSNREIADELFISVKTASVHVSNILRKLDVSGRQEAARVAHRLGVHG
ncbi:MAG: helix-turn-helix transcriptional regulator [Phycicoccus sp.]